MNMELNDALGIATAALTAATKTLAEFNVSGDTAQDFVDSFVSEMEDEVNKAFASKARRLLKMELVWRELLDEIEAADTAARRTHACWTTWRGASVRTSCWTGCSRKRGRQGPSATARRTRCCRWRSCRRLLRS